MTVQLYKSHHGQDDPLTRIGPELARLWEHRLFSALSVTDFYQLSRSIQCQKLTRGSVVYHQDTEAQFFYYVVSGRVCLYRLDPSGVTRTLDSHGPDECFADVMIYANPARYACYAEVTRDSTLLLIPTRTYRDVLRRNPEYYENLLQQYVDRAVKRFHDLEIMTVRNAKERVVRYLLDLVPGGQERDVELALPMPQCQLATRLGMQAETLSRILTELAENGLVKVSRGKLLLRDTSELLRVCLHSRDA